MEIHIGDRIAEIELVSKEDNKVVLTIDGKPFEADVVMAENGNCNILMDGRSTNAQLIRRENGKSYKVNTHYSSFNSCLSCTFKSICILTIRNNDCNFTIDAVIFNSINDRLQVCSSPRNKDSNF